MLPDADNVAVSFPLWPVEEVHEPLHEPLTDPAPLLLPPSPQPDKHSKEKRKDAHKKRAVKVVTIYAC